VNRRKVITVLGGVAALPLAARAQVLPSVGLLRSASGAVSHVVTAFRQGLAEAGFVEDRNVVIEQRFSVVRSRSSYATARPCGLSRLPLRAYPSFCRRRRSGENGPCIQSQPAGWLSLNGADTAGQS
jgi:hypothetical protein